MGSMYNILSPKINGWTRDELKKAFDLLIYHTPNEELKKLFGTKTETESISLGAKTKENIKEVVEEMKKHKAVITEERDKLREIEEELCTEADSFDEDIQELESAIGTFSKYV